MDIHLGLSTAGVKKNDSNIPLLSFISIPKQFMLEG